MGMAAFVALAIAGAAAPHGAAPHGNVPFVGCPSDGQTGPQPAPRRGVVPRVPAAAAAHLAYYASSDLGVLAPRGWHCLGLEGSNGSVLIVTPEPHGAGDLLAGTAPLRGPAVQLGLSFGGTSGRFEVARMIARLFPAHMAFARRVAAEGVDDPLPSGPYPADRIRRIGATEIAYTTPARLQGLGTGSRLTANADPIEGLVILHPEGDMDLVKLDVRLARAQRGLVSAIVAAAHRAHGAGR
jgi:hypothetical protein